MYEIDFDQFCEMLLNISYLCRLQIIVITFCDITSMLGFLLSTKFTVVLKNGLM